MKVNENEILNNLLVKPSESLLVDDKIRNHHLPPLSSIDVLLLGFYSFSTKNEHKNHDTGNVCVYKRFKGNDTTHTQVRTTEKGRCWLTIE